MRGILFLATIASAAAAFAAPKVAITDVSAAADRTISVSYTLSGGPAIVTFNVQTNDGANTWKDVGSAAAAVSGDANKVIQGRIGTAVWSPDGIAAADAFQAGTIRFVVKGWPTNDPPDYMAVDISDNSSDISAYGRLRFYESADLVPGGVLSNFTYRISKLLFKRMHAAGVTWQMGAGSGESPSSTTVEKLHSVTLSDDYYIGVFPLTEAQCSMIAGSVMANSFPIRRSMRICDKLSMTGGAAPVIRGANWPLAPGSGSLLYRLRAMTGGRVAFEIPSEAQWEFAARGGNYGAKWGNGTAYAFSGSSDSGLPGRYRFNQGSDWCTTTDIFTSNAKDQGVTNGVPVAGSYAPNSYGLYDMHGGVQEWCLDWYQADISSLGGALNVSSTDGSKTRSGAAGSYRVLRGGYWNETAQHCRATQRDYLAQGSAGDYNQAGLRICCPAALD